jgi:hypothetical protein
MTHAHLTIHQLPGSKTVTLYCGRCTGALHLALPVPAAELMGAIEQFTTRHACCDVPTKD